MCNPLCAIVTEDCFRASRDAGRHEVDDLSSHVDHLGVSRALSCRNVFGCFEGRGLIVGPVVKAPGESMSEDCRRVLEFLKSMRLRYRQVG
jgi:hypothetical protein